jgi:hypothetical protein
MAGDDADNKVEVDSECSKVGAAALHVGPFPLNIRKRKARTGDRGRSRLSEGEMRQRNTKCTSSSYFCAYKHIIRVQDGFSNIQT